MRDLCEKGIERSVQRRLVIWLGAALILAAALMAGSVRVQAATPYGKNGRLSIKNGRVVNKKGKTFVIKGVSTHGLAWYPEYVNKRAFKRLRDKWGVNTVRLAMYTAEYNGYCSGGSKSQLKELIDKGVRYATDLGMYVIIDWHILSDGNPLTHKSEANRFFKEIAKKYARYGNVMYEICNEPNGGEGSWANIKKYSKTIIKTIRSVNKKAIIIVGTPTWCQEVDKPQADPIKGFKNLAYSFHFYAGTHKEDLRSRLESAVKSGLPVIVTEFGISDASGSGGVYEAEGNRWMKLLDKYGIGRVCWNLSNKDESSALLKSSCKKTSGWVNGDLSPSGKWLVKTYTGKRLPSKEKKASSRTSSRDSGSRKREETAPSEERADSKSGVSSGEVKLTADLRQENSWQSDGQYFTQYKLILKNEGNQASSHWEAVVRLKEACTVSDLWSGSFEQKDQTLLITPLDWNKRLEENGTTEIGFIVKSAEAQSIGDVEITAQ